MSGVNRRTVIKSAAVAAAATSFAWSLSRPAAAATGTDAATELHWLEGTPDAHAGTTWGVPWARGTHRPGQPLRLTTADGTDVPVQSWPTAYWPDGSVKWTAHAIAPDAPRADRYLLDAGTPAAPEHRVTVRRAKGGVEVSTGVLTARFAQKGADTVVRSLLRGGVEVARDGRLVALRQGSVRDGAGVEAFAGRVEKVEVEQDGPVRAVVRVEGRHRHGGRGWLPFVLRFAFSAGAESLRLVHTFVWDGDQEPGRDQGDFLRGLGVRFTVPLRDRAYDRHIRFADSGGGLFTEAVQGVTGLRRDPGAAVRAAQIAGERLPDLATWDPRVSGRLAYIPRWGDYTLSQLTADGYQIRKRTKSGHGWIPAAAGQRAGGFGYIGGASGGLAFGVRDFWQRHPTQLDVRGAASSAAEVTLWLYSPEAQPLDLRFYHDGLGQNTYDEQSDGGLEITYEDYEPGFGTPYGIARTSELTFWAVEKTPDATRLAAFAQAVATPPQLAATPQRLHAAGVFGDWAPVDRSTKARTVIEDHLDDLFAYYRDQREERRWYGFLDYGDVQHTYDTDRHVWRYDVGGFAWDNSELGTDLWLWYHFLRTGSAEVFRFAEAMTRHTGEVDVYHLGAWAGLGTRHGVQHYADSAKQVRISTAANRRFFYYLTGDERTGDLLRELADVELTFLAVDPQRKVRADGYTPGDRHALSVGFGTDWGGISAAWLTEWERRGPRAEQARTKLVNSLRTIAAQPNGFFTGAGLLDADTGRFALTTSTAVNVSHLSAVFGLVETNSEIVALLGDQEPEFRTAWLNYARHYNGTDAQKRQLTGSTWKSALPAAHSRITAYAARHQGDPALASRAWKEFFTGADTYFPSNDWRRVTVPTPQVLRTTREIPWVSTNSSAQWALAAIQNLALIGDEIPS
ncbi:Tat pathway signal sequence domain protein [Streptomyces niveiscabiei]|uniref:exo-rhamnogalacturonan lyase family protein n=1 Tax=Streptomyces niveiscabiei TaxID=164115 RepID=UPI0029A7E5C8|nr:Tat pathway signal sequence domain protein [Streptomyces niveiscabiei]MDX3382126.1 Tat pathway signal sequence domain protein [Streptomyces niveiscabiei]